MSAKRNNKTNNKTNNKNEAQETAPVAPVPENVQVPTEQKKVPEKKEYEVRDAHIKQGGSYLMQNGKPVLQTPPGKDGKEE